MHFKVKLGLAALPLVAAACAPVDPGFGEAVKYDMAIQTVNPEPEYPADGAQPGDSGEHGADAAERYRTGNVKQVEAVRSTQGSGGGSGGGG